MKAAVCYGLEDVRCTNIPDPSIHAHHEVRVKVLAISICGSDLQDRFLHAFALAGTDKAFATFNDKSDSAMKVLIKP